MDCSMPGPLSSTIFQSLLKFIFIESVMLSSHLILCRPLLLLHSVFPRMRVFSSDLTLCNSKDCSTPGFPVLHCLRSLLKLMFIESVMPSNHLVLCRPHLLLPSVFPSIRIFSNESVLCIRWPKDWSFSFSIIFSNEYLGLISFMMDWFDLLAVQGTLKSSPTPWFNSINSLALSFLYSPTLISIHD